MIRADINSKTYFFTINHITKEKDNKLIYGINLNNSSYFISKTCGTKDAIQLDNKPPLNPDIINELNTVITAVELKHKKRPSIENLNREIFAILMRLRHISLNRLQTASV